MKKNNLNKKEKKNFIKDIILFTIILTISIILLSIFPQKKEKVISASMHFFIEMISIFPAVMILMGLFKVFVPQELIVTYLGKKSGIKGILLSLLSGALPTGPLYIAFPIAYNLLKKGARISNIIIFLSAWTCIKIPQEMVELQFPGLKFMLFRLILTTIFVSLMGLFIEKILTSSSTS